MSRTYVHVPYWVALNREGVEVHDHTRGDCDLPDAETRPVRAHHTFAACKKVTRFEVVCEHRYRKHPAWEYRASSINPEAYVEHVFSPKPHRVVSVTNVEIGDRVPLEAYPDLPETCETYRYPLNRRYINGNFYYREAAPEPLLTPVSRELARHTYVVTTRDPDTLCSCDNRFYDSCYRTLPSDRAHKYFRPDEDYWYDKPQPYRGAVRANLAEIRDLYNAGNLEDEDVDDIAYGVDLNL